MGKSNIDKYITDYGYELARNAYMNWQSYYDTATSKFPSVDELIEHFNNSFLYFGKAHYDDLVPESLPPDEFDYFNEMDDMAVGNLLWDGVNCFVDEIYHK